MKKIFKITANDGHVTIFLLITIATMLVKFFVPSDSLVDITVSIIGDLSLAFVVGRVIFVLLRNRKDKNIDEPKKTSKSSFLTYLYAIALIVWLILSVFTLGKSTQPAWVIVFMTMMTTTGIAIIVWSFSKNAQNKINMK